MLYLLHGDDTEQSRNALALKKQKARAKEVREINGKHLDENMLVQALESTSLFGVDVFIIIERYLSYAKKREKSYPRIIERILQASLDNDIVLYEEKEIDASTIRKLGKNTVVTLYKTPVVMFQFLDTLAPGTAKQSLALLAKTVAKEPAEVVFSVLVKRVRQLMERKDGLMPAGISPWQEARLTNQARQFTMEQLITMHEHLLNADIAVKSGSTPFTPTQLLEQIILSL